MKIKEVMERVGIRETGKAIAYIRDALEEMNTLSETHVKTARIDITEDQRFYALPHDAVKLLDIRCKNHLNNSDEYRSIPRTVDEPMTEDADGN